MCRGRGERRLFWGGGAAALRPKKGEFPIDRGPDLEEPRSSPVSAGFGLFPSPPAAPLRLDIPSFPLPCLAPFPE